MLHHFVVGALVGAIANGCTYGSTTDHANKGANVRPAWPMLMPPMAEPKMLPMVEPV